MSLYEDSQQGVCGGDGLAKVLIVVDGKQVSVDVSVSDHHLHVCDPVDGHNKTVEFLKLAGFYPIHGKPPELCPILQSQSRTQYDATNKCNEKSVQTKK